MAPLRALSCFTLLVLTGCGDLGPEDYGGKLCFSGRDCPASMVCASPAPGQPRTCRSAGEGAWEEPGPELADATTPDAGPAQPPLPNVSGTTTYCDVKPVLSTFCAGCHGATPSGGAPSGFRLDVYGGAGVTGAHQMAARIQARAVVSRTMPPSGGLTPEQLALLQSWVSAGAPDCDPTQPATPPSNGTVRFGADVKPVLSAYCVSCHGGAAPVKGLNLEPAKAYASLMSSELEGGLPFVTAGNPAQSLLVIAIGGGNSEMPAMPNGTPGLKTLSPDAYDLVRRWVEQGALNN